MTIAERRTRKEYDQVNPWRPMVEAKPDGTVCELLFCDLVGNFDADPAVTSSMRMATGFRPTRPAASIAPP